MRSEKRLDEEINECARLINTLANTQNSDAPENQIALAVYNALRWARGKRGFEPSLFIHKVLKEAAEQRAIAAVRACAPPTQHDPEHYGDAPEDKS